jgi:1,4-alpha-glucan branching enzyme
VLNNNFPHALLIAEDSSAYGGITTPVTQGGLGFDYKWNMGWMNDVLFYCRQDPLFRRYHHNKLTFSMMYSLNENYILPLSHDEVVHVKGSILNKMPGEYENKFSGERLLLGFMYAHVGKKLNFMGYEFAQFNEWNFSGGLDHFLCKFELHNKMKQFVKRLNYFYKNCRPLYEVERSWSGFEWLVVDDEINNVIVFNRYDLDGNCLLCVCNFSGIDLQNYTFGQHEGKYLLAFNSDCVKFGGKGSFRKRVLNTKKLTSHGKEFSITMDIPKLTCMYFLKQKNK